MTRERLTRRAVVALALLAVAAALVVQASGPNQAAHFALLRSLAEGTAEIDPRETIDASFVDGRFYAAKAPGLALFTLPWYGALRAVALQDGDLATETRYRDRLWQVNLVGAVLPFVVLLMLMLVAVERVVPGYGLPTAVVLGVGTLLFPFATLFFDHILAATLGFAAFVVLLFSHARADAGWACLAAGLLAGLAVVTEFPLALVAVVLAGYAAAGSSRSLRLSAYVAGGLVGIAPLLAYNAWAFGSPFRLSYTNALEAPAGEGVPVVGANDEGFYGVGLPDPRAALSLLVSDKGLLVVTPLALAALAGLPLLWRTGRRAETVVCAAVPLTFLIYNAAYYLPFGGQGPGPRFLVPALPFLAVPLGLALRARPLVVTGVAVVSAAVMLLATLTGPLTGVEYGLGTWLGRLRDGAFVETVTGRLGLGAWLSAALVVLLVLLAGALALAGLPLRERLETEGPLLAAVLAAWLLVVLVAPELLPSDSANGTAEGALAVVCLLAALAVAFAVARSYGALALLPLAPLFVLAAPQLSARPRVSLLVVLVGVGLAAVAWSRLGRDYDRAA